MASITFAAVSGGIVRSAAAQANVGQTDWIIVPRWAKAALIDFNLSAVAGTTPLADLTINSTGRLQSSGLFDDTYIYKINNHAAFTQITAAAHLVVAVGAGLTADTTTAATGYSEAAINYPLPEVLGLKLVFDRTTGDETYTYTLITRFS